MENPNNVVDKLRIATFWAGAVLLAAGAFSLLYLATILAEIITAPEGTAVVQWLVAKVSESELFLAGHLNNFPFEIKMSSALQYIFLGVIGLILVNILAAIVRTFIQSGIELIKFAGTKIQTEGLESE